MSANVSFTGFNSNFDSGGLIEQLIALETQSRVRPLQIKLDELNEERSFVGGISTTLNNLKGNLNFTSIINGNTSLAPKSVTSSDTENEFITITTTDSAVPQNFDINILQKATATIRKSATSLSLGIDTNTQLTDLNLKGFSDIDSGAITIDGETLEYTAAAKTKLMSANSLTPPADIDKDSILNDANFADGVTLTSGTITINGTQQTFNLDPATATVQDLLDFFEGFPGVTEADLVNGRVRLTGASSFVAGTSNLADALGFTSDSVSGSVLTGEHNITEHTLADWGITGTEISINGVQINFADDIEDDPPELSFDPNIETMNSLIKAINNTSSSDSEDDLNIRASYTTKDENGDNFFAFNLQNQLAGADPIVVSSSDSNIVAALDLTDETLGTDNALSNVLSFLESFSSVTSASLVNGKVELQGSFQSLGSPGDDSNMLKALGLNNAKVNAGVIIGVQNLDAPESNTKLEDIGVTGTTITINGEEITYDPVEDSLQDIVSKINNTAATRVSAFYDSLNGEIVLTNQDTGALSITISSDGNLDSILNLDSVAGQTLGDNAEFTISNLNNGEVLVSNSNTVTGLLDGVTIDISKVTTDPVSVTIAKDASGYEKTLNDIIGSVNQLLTRLDDRNDSFSRGLISRIKSTLTGVIGNFNEDTFVSFVNIGLESQLDSEGNFTGYKLDSTRFADAYNSAPDELNKLLWGNDQDGSIFSMLESGKKGIIAQLNDLLDDYTDEVVKGVQNSINSRIDTQEDRILRAQDSIERMRQRYVRQFAQLDVINAEFQQQQSALASSGLI